VPAARGHAGWDEYWAGSRAASCVPENPETAGRIAAVWIESFGSLSPGARILDVATGNGIVLAHACAAARTHRRTFALTGVDLAAIDPHGRVPATDPLLRAARFHGGVAAEKLPFAAASFDCVASQYGLEYADLERALGEAARVLAPGGRLLWLAHDEDSDVVVQNAGQRAEVDWLLARGGPYAAMRGFVDALRRPPRLPEAASALRAALVAAESYCREHPPAKVVVQVCTEFVAVAERPEAYRREDLQRMLDDGERRLRLHRMRMEDLAAAALTTERRARVEQKLQAVAWRDARVTELHVGPADSRVGLWISAVRA
jgi:ubiquinone/menaquinone biosynthesis C-methylase UbiE